MEESFPNGKKRLWEKKKLLVTSNFSFSHVVFTRLLLQTRKNQDLFWKGLNWHLTKVACIMVSRIEYAFEIKSPFECPETNVEVT